MPYRYLEEVAIADVAFEARGETLEELFSAASDATLGVMVESPSAVPPAQSRSLRTEEDSLDMLLFQLLQEIVYYKDAERLLLRCPDARVDRAGDRWRLEAELRGEGIEAISQALLLDVKAVTLHLLSVERVADGWTARVVLDV
jgi:SHS2 domain-containing protein